MPAIYRRMNTVWSCFTPEEKTQMQAYLSRFLDHVLTSPALSLPQPE